MRQPGYGAGSGGPISLTAPGVARDQGEIELPPDGTPEFAEQGVRQPYGAQRLSAAGSRRCRGLDRQLDPGRAIR